MKINNKYQLINGFKISIDENIKIVSSWTELANSFQFTKINIKYSWHFITRINYSFFVLIKGSVLKLYFSMLKCVVFKIDVGKFVNSNAELKVHTP